MKTNWLNLALYRPEIPQNTGNIGRTCVGLNIPLHIIGRPAFFISDAKLKRAGLDYWDQLDLMHYEDFADFFTHFEPSRCFFFTKNGTQHLFETQFKFGDCLVFGRETQGLPPEIIDKYPKQTVYLPMSDKIRSFNLANTAAVAAFEAYRQIKMGQINQG